MMPRWPYQRRPIALAVAAIFAATLTGCAHETTVTRTVTVDVPIATPCKVEQPARPEFALKWVDVSADVFEKTRAALIELKQRAAYEAELEAALAACR